MVGTIKDGEIGLYDDFDNRYLKRKGAYRIERDALTQVPVIDISPFIRNGSEPSRREVARQLREACINLGFFYLSGHGIPLAEFDETIAWGHRYFDLPLDVKMTMHAHAAGQPGFMRVGGLNPDANVDKAADLKERYIMSRASRSDGAEELLDSIWEARWPDEAILPGFASFMRSQLGKRVILARALARVLALSLDLPETYFDEVHRNLGVVAILNYYPPFDHSTDKRTQWSFSPHTDYGGFTLLLQDDLGGLQVRNAVGDWIDVPPVTGTFVVNIGDLFATWTNDLYTSNLHRALNVSDKARISFPFFASPAWSTIIECLETCQGADRPARYPPIAAGEYVRTLIEQADRTGRPGLSTKTAERFRKSQE